MIVWVDTETTGLNPMVAHAHLLEVALVVTDDNLIEIAETSVLVKPIGYDIMYVVENMDPVVREMHTENGLIDELRAGKGVRRYIAENTLIDWVWHDACGPLLALKDTPLAGSTVGFDRNWLREHMPQFESLFSYRSIDVSSVTELAKRWASSIYEGRPKAEKKPHRALPDIKASIECLRYYRDKGFIGAMP
jgi:oligoribonuclease